MYIMSRNVYILFEIVVCFLLLLLLYFLLLNIGKKLDRKNPGYVNRRGDSVGSFSRLFLSITLIERMRSIYPFVELTYACISVQQQSSTKHEECERERKREKKKENTAAVSGIRLSKNETTMLLCMCVRLYTRLQSAIFNHSIPLVHCCHSTCVFLHLFFDSKRTSARKISSIH